LFREYFKQKSYADALSPWRWTFNNCPNSSGNIYKNGPKIIKERMKVDKQNKAAYIDTLMMIFDQRIKYFRKEGYVLGLKGYELIGVDKDRSEEGLGYLKQSLDLEGNKSSVQAVYGYMQAIVNLEKKGEKTKQDVLEAYARISEIIDYNIANETKTAKHFVQYSEKIENLFTPYANCDDLITLFTSKFDSNTENIDFLKRVTKNLKQQECINNELYLEVIKQLNELEPTFETAMDLSNYYFLKKKWIKALFTLNKALIKYEEELDETQILQAELGIANISRLSGRYKGAIDAVDQILEKHPNYSEAYLLKGNIYISGASSCGNDFEQQTVYWVAVDAFKKALSDEKTKVRASKNINTYSKYFPAKETCFFNGVEPGKSHTIGCWINKTTIARTSD
jgi:hypothetical protein